MWCDCLSCVHTISIVTALFAFAGCPPCHAMIIVRDIFNTTLQRYDDQQAKFGPPIPPRGVWGHLVFAEPNDACTKINPPPYQDSNTTWIALIIRYSCNFDKKVYHAQQAGYAAVIIYNNGSEDLVPMHSDGQYSIMIPSVFTAESSGRLLEQFDKRTNVSIVLWESGEPLTVIYFIVLGCISGLGIILGICIVFANWLCHRARKRMSLLSKRKLKKLPVHKFRTGDRFETCAICLDEYIDGDKLRVLPCGHAYHCKCIDPWLTQKMNTCPLCKDVVGRRGRQEVATPEERRPLLLQTEADAESDTRAAGSDSATDGAANPEALAEIHTLPNTTAAAASGSTFRSYGSIDGLSASPPLPVVASVASFSVVINEDTFSDRVTTSRHPLLDTDDAEMLSRDVECRNVSAAVKELHGGNWVGSGAAGVENIGAVDTDDSEILVLGSAALQDSGSSSSKNFVV